MNTPTKKIFTVLLCAVTSASLWASNEIRMYGVTITDEIAESGIVAALNDVAGVTASFKQKQYTITFWTDDTKTSKITSTKAYYNTSVAEAAEYAQSLLTTPSCARFIKWSSDHIAAVQGDDDMWPVWENPTTYTVVFKNRDTDEEVATRTEVDCNTFANPPAAESGYKWQWESDDYKNVTDDLVIYGKLVANPAGIEQTNDQSPMPNKMIKDNHLYLMYNGQMYNVQGAKMNK